MLPSYGSIPAMGYQGPDPAGFPFFGKDCVDFGEFLTKTAIFGANVEVSCPKVEPSDTIAVVTEAKIEPTNPPVVESDAKVKPPNPRDVVSDTPVVVLDAMVEPANSTTALSYSPMLPANPKVNELDSTVEAANMQAVKLDSTEELLYPPVEQASFASLCRVGSREAVPAFNFHWHHACHGWLAQFYFTLAAVRLIPASLHRALPSSAIKSSTIQLARRVCKSSAAAPCCQTA